MTPWLPLDLAVALALAVSLLRTTVLASAAVIHARQRPMLPVRIPMTVVIPAHNEESCIEATVRSVARAAQHADVVRIIVVDDGSTDGTAARLRSLQDIAGLLVCSLPRNLGKAHALSVALAMAEGELLVTVDADTALAQGALALIAAPFADPEVAAVAGNVKVAGRSGWFSIWQSIEYIGALGVDRRGQAALGCITTVPGAFGAWRIALLRARGGFSAETLTEDTDMTLALGLAGHRIVYQPLAVAHTEAPSSLRGLFRQRSRWLHGNLQCLFKYAPARSRAPARYRRFGLPDFAWKHLLAFLLFPLSLAWLPRAVELFEPSALLGLTGLLFSLDLLLVALAYRLDREAARELLHLPLQRLFFPLFLWGVFAAVTLRWARGARAPWSRAERLVQSDTR